MDREGSSVEAMAHRNLEAAGLLGSLPDTDPLPQRKPLEFLDARELLSDPRPIDWLVRGFLEAGSLASVFGPSESFKSFIAVDLSLSVATGTEWHGHRVKQGAVFYLCAEGSGGIRRRVSAWEKVRAAGVIDSPFYVFPVAVDLSNQEDCENVGLSILAECKRLEVLPVLAVIDTLSRNSLGDENSTRDMAQLVSHVDTFLRVKTGATVLFVHHTGLADLTRARGSSVLRAALDSEFRVERRENSRLVSFTCAKAKDWDHPPAMCFELESVELTECDDEGKPTTSLVLRTIDASRIATRSKVKGKNQAKALEAIERLHAEQVARIRDSGREATTVPILVSQWRDASGLDRRRFGEAENGLIGRGLVRIDGGQAFLSSGRRISSEMASENSSESSDF